MSISILEKEKKMSFNVQHGRAKFVIFLFCHYSNQRLPIIYQPLFIINFHYEDLMTQFDVWNEEENKLMTMIKHA